ncbi:acetyl-CoA synthetase-like protein [Lentinus tigrinus ALCF2SS1-7]|uniref:Acetyl-CoA synthetase-like protein n=1 Tax=Lentinus tigrinus ALCF2SS1-6 TaxID=1328759 RepID=A0A5C2S5F5_9APHY|nr:acetyl-CoA synthetase-like protein [Lentinus tigrinus ALCF2SS1-6]RPD72966.1 acetyl-CoA synthetase-like protein [Lentinus tigrinus ALCF2SS1-7]
MPAQPHAVYQSPRALIESSASAITIPGLYEWHAEHNPNYSLFRFHDGQAVKDVTYAQACQGIRRVAKYVRAIAGSPSVAREPVAILANADSITYCLTSVGILRAGHVLFPISVRNSSAAVAELLRRTGCKHVLVSADEHMSAVARCAVEELKGVSLHPIQTFEGIFPEGEAADDGEDDLRVEYNVDDVAMILHSSGDRCADGYIGSTGHPKPIYWTHKRMVSRGTTSWYGEVDLTGHVIAGHGTPMFHAHGVSLYSTAVTTGIVIGVFAPAAPPVFSTSENVFEGAMTVSADHVVTVPPFVEEWARDPKKVDHMRRIKGVWFGGGELQQEVGDRLASQGVSLIIVYGCTEVGAVANVIPADPGMDYAYFSVTPWIQTKLLEAGDEKYEIVVLSPPDCPLPVVNTKIDGMDGFATNDLVVPHPTRPGMWKLYGRRDDQIVLSNGEKTNPLPLERGINDDPHVQDCVMFGNMKFQNGVLVQPIPELDIDPDDEGAVAKFRNLIWPTVERVNAGAPQQSRIFKEMILVTSPSKPFDYNAKGNIRRGAILQRYAKEIDALYDRVEQSVQGDIAAPSIWDPESTRSFVRAVIRRVMMRPLLDDSADFFRSGCDRSVNSFLLQATWIRNTILRAIRETLPHTAHNIPMNLVFKAPSINALSDTIYGILHNRSEPATTSVTPQDLVDLVEKYSSNLPPRPSPLRQREQTKDTILITGTTGGFGCDILEHLLLDEGVEKIYAFNRPGSQAMERQRASFRKRGLDETLLESPRFRMVDAVLDTPGFGLEATLLEEIRNSVTHIMHNAWKVDVNLSLPSFEPDLRAVRNFVELSLSAPYIDMPIVQFVSTVGVLRNCELDPPIPEVQMDPSSSIGTGYSEAKWVAEGILANVKDSAEVPAVIVRLGQVCGDRNGYWKENEWFPPIVKTALSLGCLPDMDGSVSFIPGYSAARAFTEMRKSPSGSVLHLVHPRPVPWRTVMAPIAKELGVPMVPFTNWIAAIQQLASGDGEEVAQRYPAVFFLSFFKRKPVSLLQLDTRNARAQSGTLDVLDELGEGIARRWVAGWRASEFLPPSVIKRDFQLRSVATDL